VTKLRVYIATTEGPSEIQGMIEEDSDLQSVICLDGTASALPVSAGYDAFVRKPTGVVEKVTGNRVYRMDVSHPITNGNSWQTGVYLAHMLEHSNLLASKNEGTECVILATGALRTRDLHIDPVGHIEEKLQAANTLFQTHKVSFLLPTDDYKKLSPEIIENYEKIIKFIPLENADDIIAKAFDEGSPSQKVTEISNKPHSTPSTPLPTASTFNGKGGLISLILLGVFIVAAGGYGFIQWQVGLGLQKELARMTRNGHYVDLLEFKDTANFDGIAGKIANHFFPIREANDDLTYYINQISPDDGKSCAGMRFRNADYKSESLSVDNGVGSTYKLINGRNLCAFEIGIHNKGLYDLEILSLIKPNMLMGRHLSPEEGGEVESFILPANASRSIEIKLPLFRNRTMEYDIWVIGALKQSRQLFNMLKEEARADNSLSFNWDNLRDVGVNIIEANIKVGD